jgi:hypothetical protein
MLMYPISGCIKQGEQQVMNPRKSLAAFAVAGVALLGGGLMSAMSSGAASAASTDTTVAVSQPAASTDNAAPDPSKGGHVGQNGTKEELLTGDAAAKVTAAATAAVPGAKIDRVETDAEGDVYEAHITKADGSRATLKFDANFALTKTEDSSNMPAGKGQRGQNAQKPAAASTSAVTTA